MPRHEQSSSSISNEAYFINAFRDKWEVDTAEDAWKEEIRERLTAKLDEFDCAVHFASDHRGMHSSSLNLFESVIKDSARNLDRKLHGTQKVHLITGDDMRTQYVFFPESKTRSLNAKTILHMHGFMRFPRNVPVSAITRSLLISAFWGEITQLAFRRGLVRERNKNNHEFYKVYPCTDTEMTTAAITYATKQQHLEENMGQVIQFGSFANPL